MPFNLKAPKPDAVAKLKTVIELSPDHILPGRKIYCPQNISGIPSWSTHPRVYLNLDANNQVQCPYCSTLYKLP
ncbi:MAG: zinc-finger domain-containing protein [Gammaproteobacteria bacterium]|nr:zinc-finger domain-containing protein [Gammaproteobacteria bacterium]